MLQGACPVGWRRKDGRALKDLCHASRPSGRNNEEAEIGTPKNCLFENVLTFYFIVHCKIYLLWYSYTYSCHSYQYVMFMDCKDKNHIRG